MPRFFIDMPLLAGEVLALPGEVARHVQVLRLAPGDSIVLFNGQGGQHAARLVDIGRRNALAEVGEFSPIEAEPPYEIALAQGIAGGDKMDWLIEKAVELGAARVVPLSAARSVVRLAAERAQRRQGHWRSLARAACEQCGRNRVPEVEAPREFGHWLDTFSAEAHDGELRLMLSPRGARSLHSLPEAPPTGCVTLLVGPEGGLAPEEEAAAAQRGFLSLALGPRVLRTETAGMAVLAALAARWGGW